MDAAIGESNGFSQAVHGHHSRGDSTGSFDGGPSDCVRGKLNGVKWTSALRQFHHDGSASRSDSAMTNGRRNGETNDIAAYRPGSAARAVANALNTRLTNGSTRGMQNGVHNSLDPAALPTAKESSADLVHPNGTSDPLGADAAAIVAHQNGVAAESKQPTPESQEPTAKPEDTRREFPSIVVAQRLRQAGDAVLAAAALAAVRALWLLAAWLFAQQGAGRLHLWWRAALEHRVELSAIPAVAAAVVLAGVVWRWGPRRRRPVYLLDFGLWRIRDDLRVTRARFMEGSIACGKFSQESLDFQERIGARSGLNDQDPPALPPALHILPQPIITMQAARDEAEMVMFEAVERAFDATGLKPRDVGILVVNCSLFCPTPSLSAMLVNRFGMRSSILSYNLGGMGCSAGIIAIGLAEKLLQVEANANALVVSTENITQNWYAGDNRSMLIPNTLFRMGASAVILTNRPAARPHAKYELQRVVRVHLGSDEAAYRCVYQHADEKGTTGVALDRNLVKVAGSALQANVTKMGPAVLPLSEKLLFALNWMARRLPGGRGIKPYIPDFRRAFDHFCLHAGGRGVIEGLGAQLQLDDRQRGPSANTLRYYGNTSSSTVWYSLGFVESCQGLARGDTVWQVGFGSGFKANSAVWKALRPIAAAHPAWDTHPEARLAASARG